MCGHGVSVNQRSDVCLLNIVCDFLFYGYPCSKKENIAIQCPEIMEFSQLMNDILVNVSCKFEMYLLKIAQVINENGRIAFLYVLSTYINAARRTRQPHEKVSEFMRRKWIG